MHASCVCVHSLCVAPRLHADPECSVDTACLLSRLGMGHPPNLSCAWRLCIIRIAFLLLLCHLAGGSSSAVREGSREPGAVLPPLHPPRQPANVGPLGVAHPRYRHDAGAADPILARSRYACQAHSHTLSFVYIPSPLPSVQRGLHTSDTPCGAAEFDHSKCRWQCHLHGHLPFQG